MWIISYCILSNLIDIQNCYLQLNFPRLYFVRFNNFVTFLCACCLLFLIWSMLHFNMRTTGGDKFVGDSYWFLCAKVISLHVLLAQAAVSLLFPQLCQVMAETRGVCVCCQKMCSQNLECRINFRFCCKLGRSASEMCATVSSVYGTVAVEK